VPSLDFGFAAMKSWWSSAAESASASASEAFSNLSRTLAATSLGSSSASLVQTASQQEQERLGLLRELKAAVRATIEEASTRSKELANVELDERDQVVRELLLWLERCLWHGLRTEAKVRRKSPDGSRFVLTREPDVSLWNLVQYLQGGDIDVDVQKTVTDINELLFVRTNIGKGRAWLRHALNEKVLDAAVGKLASQMVVMQVYYESYALMRNEETSLVLASMLSGLNGLEIRVHIDVETWDALPPPLRGVAMSQLAAANKTKGIQGSAQNQRKVQLDMPAKSLRKRALNKRKKLDAERRNLARTIAFLGSPLEMQVQTITVSALAYQEPSIAVPNVLLRAVALFWEYKSREYSPADLFAGSEKLRPHVVDAKRKLTRLGNDGLTIFSRVDVDVDLSTAMSSIAATTRAGLSEALLPSVVGGVVVAFLSGLPTSLVPQSSYEPLLLCAQIDDAEARRRNIALLIETFPLGHRATLDLLTRTLDHLFGTSSESCAVMSATLAPLVLRPEEGQARQLETERQVLMEVLESHVECLGKTRQDLRDMRSRLADKWGRLRRYRDDIATPVRADIHQSQLYTLWEVLAPSGAEEDSVEYEGGVQTDKDTSSSSFERSSERDWQSRGAQGKQISDEFRGGGKFALDMLIYFGQKHRSKARLMIESANFPFLRAGAQVARMCNDILQISAPDYSVLPETAWWPLLNESDAVPRIFCMAFLLLDINFTTSGAALGDFSRVALETKIHISDLMSLGPETINKLWHSWIQLRAERMIWAKSQSDEASEKAAVDAPNAPKVANGASTPGVSSINTSSLKQEDCKSTPKTQEQQISDAQDENTSISPTKHLDNHSKAASSSEKMAQSFYEGIDLDQLLPIVIGDTETLSNAHVSKIEAALPTSYQGYDWKLIFSSHGTDRDISEFYEQAAPYEATLLVVRDKGGAVFGGFCSQAWALGNASYYGSSECFLFTLEPNFQVFRASQQNTYYMLANEDSLALGGGGEFGLFLDEDFLGGTSGPCETFDSPCLASEPDFTCVSTELFALQVRKR